MLNQPMKRIRTAGKNQGAGRSLAMRRVWYAQDAQVAQGGEKTDEKATEDADSDQDADEAGDDELAKLPPAELAKLLRETRRRAGGYRTQLRDKEKAEAQAKADADKAAQEKRSAEEKALQEQGNFKTLYEKQQDELKLLRDKAARVDAIEQKLKARNETRLKAIPDSHKSLIPKGYSAEQIEEWLDANEKLLVNPASPDLNAGKKGERRIAADPNTVLRRIPK